MQQRLWYALQYIRLAAQNTILLPCVNQPISPVRRPCTIILNIANSDSLNELSVDMEVLAEMVTKAPTRVAIVEPCLGEPKDFEVPPLTLWN